MDKYWWLVAGGILGLVVIIWSWRVHKRGSSSSGRSIWKVLLLWPLLFEADARRTDGHSPRRLLMLVAVMVIIAIAAILLTPSRH